MYIFLSSTENDFAYIFTGNQEITAKMHIVLKDLFTAEKRSIKLTELC